jgi:hypothetical protein
MNIVAFAAKKLPHLRIDNKSITKFCDAPQEQITAARREDQCGENAITDPPRDIMLD